MFEWLRQSEGYLWIDGAFCRKELIKLIETGNFKKIYGGVAVVKNKELLPFHDRKIRNQSEKRYIAQLASDFIENGDIIFIDSGTKTIELFEFIKRINLKKDSTYDASGDAQAKPGAFLCS